MENVVRRIVIEKLHDLYDYDIAFDKGGISLITGPNGYGKTTLLKIIKNAFSVNFWYFYDLLFKSIEIYFGDDTKLVLNKVVSTDEIKELDISDDRVKATFSLSDEEQYVVHITHYDKNSNILCQTTLDTNRFLSILKFSTRVRDLAHSREIPSDAKFSIQISEKELAYVSERDFDGQFMELRMFAQDHNCLSIQAQRIFKNNSVLPSNQKEEKSEYVITQLADLVKQMYQEQKNIYAEKSQQIDSTFVQRLINNSDEPYSKDVYQEKILCLKSKIASFEKYGLVEKNYDLVEDYRDDLMGTLSLQIDDLANKFSVYDEFYGKLERFDKFVSGKGLSNKRMVLDSKFGITFMSDNGLIIPLEDLSSGEQNLVILYYRLVFETNENTLLLVDEPENSMHVEWLRQMLDDYKEIEKAQGCQMVIATHSPIFINDNWEIAFDLYGGSYQDFMES